jgi:hypothetical protein
VRGEERPQRGLVARRQLRAHLGVVPIVTLENSY